MWKVVRIIRVFHIFIRVIFILKKEKSFICLFWKMCKETLRITFHVYSVRVFCKQANHVKRIDIYPNKALSALVITMINYKILRKKSKRVPQTINLQARVFFHNFQARWRRHFPGIQLVRCCSKILTFI